MTKERNNALGRAIEAAGGTGALAASLGITAGAISQWGRVPAERVIQIEAVSGVSRRDLRPDLYPPEPERVAQ